LLRRIPDAFPKNRDFPWENLHLTRTRFKL
jgi:hypothetical protein